MIKNIQFDSLILSNKDLNEITRAIKSMNLSSESPTWAKFQVLSEYLNTITNKIAEIILTEIDSNVTIVLRPLKSNATLLPKIERINGPIHMVQDLSGLRIVKEFTLDEQDDLCEKIQSKFDAYVHHIKDRRKDPSVGYRALHVILKIDKVFVEIQIRTTLQHDWADAFEWFADLYGRQIRYGEMPLETYPAKDAVLRELLTEFMNWSLLGTVRLEEVLNSGIKDESLARAYGQYSENIKIINGKLRLLGRLKP